MIHLTPQWSNCEPSWTSLLESFEVGLALQQGPCPRIRSANNNLYKNWPHGWTSVFLITQVKQLKYSTNQIEPWPHSFSSPSVGSVDAAVAFTSKHKLHAHLDVMRMLQTISCHQFRINRRTQPSEPSRGESGLWPPNRQKTWLLNATWSHKWKTKRLSRNFSWNLSRCRFSRNFSLFTQQFCKLNCYAQKFKQVPMGRETIALVSSSRGLGSGFVVALASSETPTKRTNDKYWLAQRRMHYTTCLNSIGSWAWWWCCDWILTMTAKEAPQVST